MTKRKNPDAPSFRADAEERLARKLDKNGPVPSHVPDLGPCHVFTGSLDTSGYGLIKVKGKLQKVHRFVYELTYGLLLPTFIVCHKCDNTRCCNPDHLFPGTKKNNMEDRGRKGRTAVGSRVGRAKLCEMDIILIREKLSKNQSRESIAQEFKVKYSMIANIDRGLNWKHVL